MTDIEVKQSLDGLTALFPSGKYWQHYPSDGNSWDSLLDSAFEHSSHDYYGDCGCNSFYNSIQCAGFALYMAYRVFGHYPLIRMSQGVSNGQVDNNGWKYYTNGYFSGVDLAPGDIVYQLKGNNITHYAIVHYIDSAGNVYFAEALGSDNSRIAWGFFDDGSQYKTVAQIKSIASCIMKAPKSNDTVRYTVRLYRNYSDSDTEQVNTMYLEAGKTYSENGITLPTLSRENYLFAGWFTDPVGGTQHTANTTVPAVDYPLYAQWIPLRTVRFYRNYSDSDTVQSDKMYLEAGKTYRENGVTLYTPPREDYRFDGWFTDRVGGTQHTLDTIVHGYDYNLYAHWTRVYVNISYYRNHSDSDTTVYVKKHNADTVYGDSLLDLSSLDGWARDHYKFAGWYTDREGGTQHTADSIIKTYDHPLFARWKRVGTIHYMRNYTVNDDKDIPRIGVEDEPLNARPMPHYDDYETDDAYYTFDGWYTSRSGGIRYTENSIFPNVSDLYLYAHWTRVAAVTYIENSVSPDSYEETLKFPVGEAITVLPAGCDGYRFDGWYTAEVGGTRYINGTIVPAVKNLTLYGHWTRIVNVTLKCNFSDSDTSSYSTINAYGGEAYGEALPTSKDRSGYRFDGWFTERSGGNQVTSETLCSNSDHSLYAHWTKVTAVILSDNYSGNSVTVYCPTNEKYGSVLTQNVPVREGCIFDGWYTESGSDGRHVFATSIVPENTVVLYAHWIVKVIFNPCGGCVLGNSILYYDVGGIFGKLPEVCCCEEKKYFDGWYTLPNGYGEKISFLTSVPDYSMVLYANWRPEL